MPTFKKHLLCDDNNPFPCDLNKREIEVLEKELAHDGSIGRYRNPSGATHESLGISYYHDKKHSIVRPDFMFFSKKKDGSIAVGIIDPHSHHLSDALPKLIGLAHYTENHNKIFRRIEAITKIDDKLKYLDLTNPEVRNQVFNAQSAKNLFEGKYGFEYV